MLNRDIWGLSGRLLMGGAAAILLGLIYSGKGPSRNCGIGDNGYSTPYPDPKTWSQLLMECYSREFSNLILCNTLACLVVSLNASLFALSAISPEYSMFRRMKAASYNRLAYLLGKDLAQLECTILAPLIFVLCIRSQVLPESGFMDYLIPFVLLHWCWAGLGYAAAILFEPSSAQLFCMTCIVAGTLVSGGNPPLVDLKDTAYGTILSSVSPQRWAQEALFTRTAAPAADDLVIPGPAIGGSSSSNGYVCQLVSKGATYNPQYESYCGNRIDAAFFNNTFGYEENKTGLDMLMMVALGLAFRLIAYLAILFRERESA